MRKTKILATIGPASWDKPILKEMIRQGLDGCRINFSHTPEAQAKLIVDHARSISEELQKPFAIRQDLQGPKLRIGNMHGNPLLKAGQQFVLELGSGIGDSTRAYFECAELFDVIAAGTELILADGSVRLGVMKKRNQQLNCEVLTATGSLGSKKGISAPGVHLKIPALTEKDKKDFEAGIRLGVDVVSLSFVKCAEDVDSLRTLMKARGYQVPIIAKIELREAVEKLDEIIEAVDGVAVARGDLQVAYALSEVPRLQRHITEASNRKGKFVLIGSGVLTSMKEKSAPGLADVSDLFLCVECRPDAISFSDETAVGKYPVQCIQVMDKLITEMETQIENAEALSREAAAIYHPENVIPAAKSGRYSSIITAMKDRRVANWLAMHRGVYVALTSGTEKNILSKTAHAYAKKIGMISADERLLELPADKF
jgi:pyruvate kinase